MNPIQTFSVFAITAFLLGCSTVSKAQIPIQESSGNDITFSASVFQQQPSRFQADVNATITDSDGMLKLRLPQIGIDPGSMILLTNDPISTYQLSNSQSGRPSGRYSDLEGITVTMQKGDERYTGEVVSYSGSELQFKLSDGSFVIIPKPQDYVILTPVLPDKDTSKASDASLHIQTDLEKSDSFSAQLLFESRALSWKASHTLFLTNDLLADRFLSKASLRNLSGTDFKNLNTQLVFGESQRSPSRNYPMMMAEASQKRRSDSSPDQGDVQQTGDLYYYPFNEPLSIPAGDEIHFNLLNLTQPESRHFYAFSSRGFDQNKEWQYPVSTLIIDGSTIEDDLRSALPAGEVSIYLKNNNETMTAAGSTRIPITVKGEDIEIDLGSIKNLKIKEYVSQRNQITNKVQELTYKIEVQNLKSSSAELNFERKLHYNEDIVFDNLGFTEQSEDMSVATLELSANQRRTFTYKVRITNR